MSEVTLGDVIGRGYGAREKTCGTKKRHDSKDRALAHMYGIIRKGITGGRRMHVYKCPYCHYYHVGKIFQPRKAYIRNYEDVIYAQWRRFNFAYFKKNAPKRRKMFVDKKRVLIIRFSKIEVRYLLPIKEQIK